MGILEKLNWHTGGEGPLLFKVIEEGGGGCENDFLLIKCFNIASIPQP